MRGKRSATLSLQNPQKSLMSDFTAELVGHHCGIYLLAYRRVQSIEQLYKLRDKMMALNYTVAESG